MPKDTWRTASKSYRDAVRRGQQDPFPQPKKKSKKQRRLERARQATYSIPAGTDLYTRKAGEKRWRPYTTKARVVVTGFLWRNDGWYGFEHAGYELKVMLGSFRKGS